MACAVQFSKPAEKRLNAGSASAHNWPFPVSTEVNKEKLEESFRETRNQKQLFRFGYEESYLTTIRWALKRLANRGEFEANVYPHHIRHTYACKLLDNGAPLEFIQGMLGHEKASATQIYAQLRG